MTIFSNDSAPSSDVAPRHYPALIQAALRRLSRLFSDFSPNDTIPMNEAQLQPSTAVHATPYAEKGLTFPRHFSTEGASPYDDVQWEKRTASITDPTGNSIFEQKA